MSKNTLNHEQRKTLRRLHIAQIVLEVSLVVLFITFLTINVASVYFILGLVIGYVMLAASLTLFGYGIYLTVIILTMKRRGGIIAKRSTTTKRWIIATWLAFATSIILFIIGASSAGNKEVTTPILYLTMASVVLTILAAIVSIVSAHLLWRHFNHKKSHNRLIFYSGLALALTILLLTGRYTTSEDVKYKSIFVTDANLELGQSEVRQNGKNGKKNISRSILLGFQTSENTIEPVDEQIAKGSKRFQYMYCSDGSYYYYTAEQFKDPSIGYTHQSTDQCSKNDKGTQTALANTPPPEKIIQQVPVYRSPTYYGPTYTTCSESYFGNTFTCRSY